MLISGDSLISAAVCCIRFIMHMGKDWKNSQKMWSSSTSMFIPYSNTVQHEEKFTWIFILNMMSNLKAFRHTQKSDGSVWVVLFMCPSVSLIQFQNLLKIWGEMRRQNPKALHISAAVPCLLEVRKTTQNWHYCLWQILHLCLRISWKYSRNQHPKSISSMTTCVGFLQSSWSAFWKGM